MTTRNKGVYILLAPEVLERIHLRCAAEGIPEGQRGRAGGPAEWIRRLVHRELGMVAPADPHEMQSRELTGRPRRPHGPPCEICEQQTTLVDEEGRPTCATHGGA